MRKLWILLKVTIKALGFTFAGTLTIHR